MPDTPEPLRFPTLTLGTFVHLEERLIDWVATVTAECPGSEVTIVVGSGFVGAHLGRLITQRLGAHVGVRVEAVHGLAGGLAARGAAATGLRPAPEAVRLRLLGGPLRAVAAAGYFAPIHDAPGFPSALLKTFDDLREGGVPPPALAVLSDRKGRHVQRLYAAYIEALAVRRLADDAAVYEQAVTVAAAGRGGDGPLAFYGLYDLPEMQVRLVRALMSGRPRPAAAFIPRPAAGAALVEPACRLFADLGFVAEEIPPEPRRDDLGRLQRSLAGVTGPSSQSPDGSLGIVSVADEVEQRAEVAARVLAAVEAGVPAHEIAVVAPRRDERRQLAGVLRGCGLPVAARLARETPATRACRLVLDCLLPSSGPALERVAVVSLAGFLADSSRQIDPPLVARWADLARRARVVAGADEWSDRLRRLRRSLQRASDDDARRQAELVALRELLAFVNGLAATLDRLPARGGWRDLSQALVAAVERLALPAADDDGLEAVLALSELDRVEPDVGRDEFAAVARTALARAESVSGSVGQDGVAVLSPEQLRGLSFTLVLFCDLADGGFPVRALQDPVLRDSERERLAGSGRVSLPLARERDHESLLLFALALEVARERALLFVPRRGAGDARPRLPSRLLLAACRALLGRVVFAGELATDGGVQGLVSAGRRSAIAGETKVSEHRSLPAIDRRDHDLRTVLELRAGLESAPVEGYLRAVLGAAAPRRRGAHQAPLEHRLTSWDGRISPQKAGLAVERWFEAPVSPTALQDYLRCPFGFYLGRLVGLAPPEDSAAGLLVEPAEVGTIAHAVLERAFAAVAEGGQDTRAGVLASLEIAAAELFARAERDGVTGYPLAWAVRRQQLLADLRSAAAGDPCWADGILPKLLEWRFGHGESPPAEVSVGHRLVVFKGRADRIDVSPDAGVVRLLDYKTGSLAGEKEQLKKGRALQLLVYTLAAAQLYPRAEIKAGYRSVTRRGGFATLSLPIGAPEALEVLEDLLADLLEVLSSGLFPRWPGERRCEGCEFAHGCTPDALGLSRKLDDAVLTPLKSLREATYGPQAG